MDIKSDGTIVQRNASDDLKHLKRDGLWSDKVAMLGYCYRLHAEGLPVDEAIKSARYEWGWFYEDLLPYLKEIK